MLKNNWDYNGLCIAVNSWTPCTYAGMYGHVPICNNCTVTILQLHLFSKVLQPLSGQAKQVDGLVDGSHIDADANAADALWSKFNPKLLLANERE